MSNPNNLNVGMMCIKYMLFVINLMFVLTSVLLITVGTTIQTIFGDFEHFLDSHFLSPPTLLVAIGAIMLIVATFGCFGALKESTMLINVYGCLLALIFILEISAAISAFALHGQVGEMLTRTMHESIKMYPTNEYAQTAVDYMQSVLECCGVNGQNDWQGILPAVNETDLILPQSCCTYYMSEEQFCGVNFDVGCINRMTFVISQSAMLIATGATTVAFIQILGVICAFMLAKTIRRTKSMRAARRWQVQQSLVNPLGSEKEFYNQQYTQLEKTEEKNEPVTYLPTSPSVN